MAPHREGGERRTEAVDRMCSGAESQCAVIRSGSSVNDECARVRCWSERARRARPQPGHCVSALRVSTSALFLSAPRQSQCDRRFPAALRHLAVPVVSLPLPVGGGCVVGRTSTLCCFSLHSERGGAGLDGRPSGRPLGSPPPHCHCHYHRHCAHSRRQQRRDARRPPQRRIVRATHSLTASGGWHREGGRASVPLPAQRSRRLRLDATAMDERRKNAIIMAGIISNQDCSSEMALQGLRTVEINELELWASCLALGCRTN